MTVIESKSKSYLIKAADKADAKNRLEIHNGIQNNIRNEPLYVHLLDITSREDQLIILRLP